MVRQCAGRTPRLRRRARQHRRRAAFRDQAASTGIGRCGAAASEPP